MNDEAIQLLHKLTADHADNSTFIYHFGVALFQHGDKVGARLQLSRALDLHPPQELQDRIKSTLTQLN
jgi:Flp pilus assembly protein TadD